MQSTQPDLCLLGAENVVSARTSTVPAAAKDSATVQAIMAAPRSSHGGLEPPRQLRRSPDTRPAVRQLHVLQLQTSTPCPCLPSRHTHSRAPAEAAIGPATNTSQIFITNTEDVPCDVKTIAAIGSASTYILSHADTTGV